MKAVLVIDEMPTECIECPFHKIYADGEFTETHCSLTAKRNKDGVNTRAEWCPLKPLPKRNEYRADTKHEDMDKYSTGYADGWNDCLEEIEK